MNKGQSETNDKTGNVRFVFVACDAKDGVNKDESENELNDERGPHATSVIGDKAVGAKTKSGFIAAAESDNAPKDSGAG